jgi:hypothetical protein
MSCFVDVLLRGFLGERVRNVVGDEVPGVNNRHLYEDTVMSDGYCTFIIWKLSMGECAVRRYQVSCLATRGAGNVGCSWGPGGVRMLPRSFHAFEKVFQSQIQIF